jgi:uncharacterized FAD-dependent dehydrogenase
LVLIKKGSSAQVAKRSINVAALYPPSEGVGYAGGIMSAGVGGIEVAAALGATLLAEMMAA